MPEGTKLNRGGGKAGLPSFFWVVRCAFEREAMKEVDRVRYSRVVYECAARCAGSYREVKWEYDRRVERFTQRTGFNLLQGLFNSEISKENVCRAHAPGR
jgi:hypothetical protein